jgi:hypothetical protein
VKDLLLRVVYRRGENGQLYVFMYRGNLHLGTVEVDKFNCLEVFRGIENRSPIFLKFLPKEGS